MITRRHMLFGTMGMAALAAVPRIVTAAAAPTARARALVVLYMHGGASQFETFDPKPGSNSGGPTRAIDTAIDGVRFAEDLPQLASRANRLAVLRTVTMREGNHDRARYLMRTGQSPAGGVAHPGLGAHTSLRHGRNDFVGAVAIGAPTHPAGLIGMRHAALTVRKPLEAGKRLRELDAQDDRSVRRAALFEGLQGRFAQGRDARLVEAQSDSFTRARQILASADRSAFDLGSEPSSNRSRYGDSDFGDGCLLARRLVDANVAYVEVGLQGWDTHEDNFARTKTLARQLDLGMAALLDDLVASGRLADTIVLCMGDFGRSPGINAREGRDHFPTCNSVVLAGGGLPGGIVVGETTADGSEVAERPIAVADLYRTLFARLEIDADEVRMSPSGRPITTVDGGKAMPELT
jgi:uncharacterized protein (DUF1501 family)